MARKKRYIVIATLAFLFLTSAPLIVFYSLGWRIDFKTLKISQPGIFYFKAYPNSIQVLINGKVKKKTDFFFGTSMIENLSPAKYDVELSKDGFFPWKKKLEIKKGEATEAKNLVLFSRNPEIKMISQNISEIFMPPDGKSIIVREDDKKTQTWALSIIEPKSNAKFPLVSEKDFLNKAGIKFENVVSDEIEEMIFSENERTILVKISLQEKQKPQAVYYFIIETDNSPPTISFLDFSKQNISKAEFNPINDKKLAVMRKGKQSKTLLAEVDLPTMKIIDTKISDVLDFTSFNGNYYYLDNSGFIYKTDAAFTLPLKINSRALDINKWSSYSIKATSFGIAIKEDNSLYFFNIDKDEMKKLSDNVSDFSFSKSIYKMAYWDKEAKVLFMDKENYQPQKKIGDEILILKSDKKIDKLLWLNDFYLIFNMGSQIKIAETDDRDQINIIDFADYPEPEIFWSKNSKIFYIFSDKNLYSFENLIP